MLTVVILGFMLHYGTSGVFLAAICAAFVADQFLIRWHISQIGRRHIRGVVAAIYSSEVLRDRGDALGGSDDAQDVHQAKR